MSDLVKLSVEDVLSWYPCWDDALVKRAVLGISRATALGALAICRSKGVSYADTVWLMCQWLARHHPGRLVWWVCDCFEHAGRDSAEARGVVTGDVARQEIRRSRRVLTLCDWSAMESVVAPGRQAALACRALTVGYLRLSPSECAWYLDRLDRLLGMTYAEALAEHKAKGGEA